MNSAKEFFKVYLLKPICYVTIVLAALFLLNQFTFFNVSLGSNQNYNSFEVIGTGTVTAVPDIAQTTFSISEKGATQEAARTAANTKQTEAISELTKLGVKKEDIKTTGFYVNENYEETAVPLMDTMSIRPGTTKQNGYVANVTTTVKAQKVETLNQAIDKLTAIGINVGGVEYTFDDRQKYVNEAQDAAIKKAKEQAQNIAKAAGFKLGKIISVRNVDEGYGYQPYAADAVSMKVGAAPASNATELEPGSNEITSKMGITYYIKN